MKKTAIFLSIVTLLAFGAKSTKAISINIKSDDEISDSREIEDDGAGRQIKPRTVLQSASPSPVASPKEIEERKNKERKEDLESPKPSVSPSPSESPREESNGIGAEVRVNAKLGLEKVQLTIDEFKAVVEKFVSMIHDLIANR